MLKLMQALNVLLPLVYGFSLSLYASYFTTKKPFLGMLASRSLLMAIVLHTFYLLGKGLYFHYFPIASTFESFSMIALNIAVLYYIIERTTREGTTGVFFLSVICLFQLVSSMFIDEFGTTSLLLSNPMFGIHTTLTLVGISALAISALYGLMYLMLAKEIKSHHFGAIYRGLPALETIEKMGKYATAFGIVFLGIGIFLGHLWAYRILGYFFKLDPKIIITDIAWLAYAVGWLIARRFGLQGVRMSVATFWGFLIFFASIMIVNMVANTFHRFV